VATDVKYVISVDSAAAWGQLKDFVRSVDDLGKTTKGARENAKGFGSELMGKLIPSFTAASLAADVIRGGVRAVKNELRDTIDAGIEAEKVDRALESSLEIVGEAAGGAAGRLRAYASELMKKTVYDDEQIKSAQSLMITMRGTSDRVDEMTRGAIGLASVFQMDLQSAARAVAQGFEGNYRAIGMLIPAVREAKTEGEKHAAMMKALGDYYQRAEDETKTFGGRLIDLKKTYGELKETLGGFTTENELVLKSLNAVKEIVEWMNNNAKRQSFKILPGMEGLAQGVAFLTLLGAEAKQANYRIEMARKDFGSYTAVVWNGVQALQAFNPYLTEANGLFAAAPFPIKKTGDAAGEAAADFQTIAQRVAELNDDLRLLRALGGNFNIITPVSNQLGSLGDMIGGTTGQVVDFTEKVPGLFDGLKTGAAGAKDAASGMASDWDSAMLSMTAGLVTFGDANATVWGNIGNVFGSFIKSALSGMESMYLRQLLISKGIIKAKQGEATASHMANIFKSVPFPLDLILAAGAFAVVNSLFSKILKFKDGGFFTEEKLALVGHGPEYVLPEARLERLIERTVIKERTGGRGGGNVYVNLNVHTQRLDDAAIYELAPKISRALRRELVYGERY
jgi:hypothetical protein